MATNMAHATYTEVIDLQTTPDTVSVIGIHTPQGIRPYKRLKGFFQQFRKYRYNGIKSFTMVPAAQLPVDPLGLTGQPQTTDLMDPRDALNPILFHGCHGDHLDSILDEIYSSGIYTGTDGKPYKAGALTEVNVADSADEFKHPITNDFALYYSKLTDSTWKKFGIQSGVKLRNLHPLVHKVAMNMPLLPGVSGSSTVRDNANEGLIGKITDAGVDAFGVYSNGASDVPSASTPVSITGLGNEAVTVTNDDEVLVTPVYRQQFTNGMTGLGWLPTSTLESVRALGGLTEATAKITILPRLYCGVLVMPPAYNVQQFFRAIIVHSFSFSGFTSSLSLMDPRAPLDQTTFDFPYSNWIDYGDTLDGIGSKSEVISDGVM